MNIQGHHVSYGFTVGSATCTACAVAEDTGKISVQFSAKTKPELEKKLTDWAKSKNLTCTKPESAPSLPNAGERERIEAEKRAAAQPKANQSADDIVNAAADKAAAEAAEKEAKAKAKADKDAADKAAADGKK